MILEGSYAPLFHFCGPPAVDYQNFDCFGNFAGGLHGKARNAALDRQPQNDIAPAASRCGFGRLRGDFRTIANYSSERASKLLALMIQRATFPPRGPAANRACTKVV